MPEARLERTRRSYMNEYGLGRNYWQRLSDNLDMLRVSSSQELLMRDFLLKRDGDAVSKPMK